MIHKTFEKMVMKIGYPESTLILKSLKSNLSNQS